MDKKLLILDLDETLIYGTMEPLSRAADGRVGDFHIYNRPGVSEFLSTCRKVYRLAVWTSSSADYAAGVVEHLLGNASDLEFVWARERCTLRFDPRGWEYRYTKNIKKVKKAGYSVEHVVVVDNTAEKWDQSYGNLVLVRDFEGDPNDTELGSLGRYLAALSSVENVREVEKRGWPARVDSEVGD